MYMHVMAPNGLMHSSLNYTSIRTCRGITCESIPGSSFLGSPLAPMKNRKGGGEPGIDSHVIPRHDVIYEMVWGRAEIKNTIIINQMTTSGCMVTAVLGFIEQVGSMIKRIPKHNYHPSIPHNSIKLQRASTNMCQQVTLYQFTGIHLLAIIQFRTR